MKFSVTCAAPLRAERDLAAADAGGPDVAPASPFSLDCAQEKGSAIPSKAAVASKARTGDAALNRRRKGTGRSRLRVKSRSVMVIRSK
jgi:hypothetical protein